MPDYAQFWAPQSFEEAEFHIDTGHTGAAFWVWGRDMAALVEGYYPDEPVATVVDYGCGVGRVLKCLKAERRIGIDVSPEMLALAKRYARGCEFIEGDGRSIPLADGEADMVYSVLVLQHMDAADAARIVSETARVLRKGGRCFLQFSGFGEAWSPTATLPRSACTWTGSRDTSGHGARQALAYTSDIVRFLGSVAGFAVVEVIAYEQNTKLPYYALVGTR